MRKIKFRAWDKKSKSMLPVEQWANRSWVAVPVQVGEEEWELNQLKLEDVELMQYTGLKDKNGVEIYENDYLGDWWVVWGSGKYILQNISNGDIMDCTNQTTYDKEITGNSHKHPRKHKAMASDL